MAEITFEAGVYLKISDRHNIHLGN